MTRHDEPATVESSLRLGGGLQMNERAAIIAGWQSLDERLRSFPAGSVELELTVKERATPSQHTTLEAWIAGRPRLVATSTHTDFAQALVEVRDDLIRQVTDAKNRSEPRNNRRLRDTEPR